MRKLIVSMMVSANGYIQGRDSGEHWHNWNTEMQEYMDDFLIGVDTFIYGRVAYEEMIAYWPNQIGEFAERMNEASKWVYSKSLSNVTWNTELKREINPAEIFKAKSQVGKDIVIFGGSGITQSFMAHGLVDEFRLIVNPLLLGKGKPYFQGIDSTTRLNLKSATPFACGNVLLIYTPSYDYKANP